jgi:CDP-glucose 4,6-dehydratase
VEYQESDPLGGYDPYASSKACSELATQAYRRSYNLNVATTRAGNVIGGGDFAKDRLVPDFVRAILKGEPIRIRNPQAVRPWQYVLEPLAGYLLLAEKLSRFPGRYNSAWNFGPNKKDARPVEWLAKKLCLLWGDQAGYALDRGHHPHEADLLVLDASKAKQKLNWRPRWDLETGLEKIIDWTRAYQAGAKMRQVCFQQIKEYANE